MKAGGTWAIAVVHERCVVCHRSEKITWEHFIPESVGGLLKLKCLCQDCNSNFGSSLVAPLRKDPRIRLALENLQREIPDVYQESQEGLPFVGKALDGSVVTVTEKEGKLKVRGGPGARNTRIMDPNDARKMLLGKAKKEGLPKEVIDSLLENFDGLSPNETIVTPGGHGFISRKGPKLGEFRGQCTELISQPPRTESARKR